jgi:hypothetical protein
MYPKILLIVAALILPACGDASGEDDVEIDPDVGALTPQSTCEGFWMSGSSISDLMSAASDFCGGTAVACGGCFLRSDLDINCCCSCAKEAKDN